MLYNATLGLPIGKGIIMENNDWLRPHDVEQLLGVKWTRPRRTRILNSMAEAGVIIRRPVPGSTLIDRTTLEAYIKGIEDGTTQAPGWYVEIQKKV